MKPNFKAMLVVMALVGVFSAPIANAGLIVEKQWKGFGVSTWAGDHDARNYRYGRDHDSTYVNFSGADASKGTLTSVMIKVHTYHQVWNKVQAKGYYVDAKGYASSYAKVSLVSPGYVPVIYDHEFAQSSCWGYYYCRDRDYSSDSDWRTINITGQAYLSHFLNTSVVFKASNWLYSNLTYCSWYDYCKNGSDAKFYGKIHVKYTYEVPEPGTLGLLGLGLLGLGAARKFRKA